MKRVFPIQSDTSCLLKWAWSTVYLKQGTSASCCRSDQGQIPLDNFAVFHNLPNKLEARKVMRQGQWPATGCESCELVERAGGISDRQFQIMANHDHDRTPHELLQNPNLDIVTPTVLDVYFNNTCNMACLYCGSHFSSKWEEENRRFGPYFDVANRYSFGHNTEWHQSYDRLVEQFWQWLDKNHMHLRYFQVLGGEPFFQPEFEQAIDFFESHPSPDLNFNIITNMKVAPARFKHTIDRFGDMIKKGQLRGLQISSSLDCWGPQQEYVRYGLDLDEWTANFEYLLDKPWVTQCVNAAVSSLTIKTLPELIKRINTWNDTKPGDNINFSFMAVQAPVQMSPMIFGPGVFDQDFEIALAELANHPGAQFGMFDTMQGIAQQIQSSQRNTRAINGLISYLDEIDRRRQTSWRELFPWLDQTWS